MPQYIVHACKHGQYVAKTSSVLFSPVHSTYGEIARSLTAQSNRLLVNLQCHSCLDLTAARVGLVGMELGDLLC